MFKIRRKLQILPSSRIARTTLFTFPSSFSYCKNNALSSSSSSLCNNITMDRSSKSKKILHQQQRNEQDINNTRSSRPKQFLAYFRCCCYRLCSFTCEYSIPSNTIQDHHVSSIFTRQNRSNHLRRYIFERNFIEIKTKQIYFPKLNLFILLLFLFPLTFASKLPSTTNLDLFILTDYTLTFTFNLSLPEPQWHAGCCLKPNQTMCDKEFYPTTFDYRLYGSNNASNGTFLFDSINPFNDRRRLFPLYNNTHSYDFLKNQTLFCKRYDTYRNLSSNHLAIFTYCIVIIGIIFNVLVFFVLMCGSLRRSTSFNLFLALTCFDLLSLASSLFALLFRTVFPFLKNSPIFCKMFGIFFLYFRQCSSTTLLLISLERCIVIKYPFCRYIFDKFRLPFLACIMLIYGTPIPFDFIFYTTGELHCEAFDTIHAHRYQIFRGFLTVFTYALIPFVVISISNFLIIMELKNSKKRFRSKSDDGAMTHFTSNLMDKRGTTVMLFVASLAFLLLLGPFYLHWCIAYLFYNYKQCHFTRNLYENVQVCMGVFHPYLTVIEKGMRESNHAINFLLYMVTSKRFRSDFKCIFRRLVYQIFGRIILFFYRHICFCCKEPSCISILEQRIIDTTDLTSTFETSRKNQAAYKTSHYYSNVERRRKNQLLQATLLNNNPTTTTGTTLTPTTSYNPFPEHTAKTVRMLTWNPYDPMIRQAENKRQAARLSKHAAISNAV